MTTKKDAAKGVISAFFGFFAAEYLSVFSLICCAYAIAAEQKARTTYDNILRVSDDPDVSRVIAYLRAREVVHFQRFGEALDNLQSKLLHKQVKGTGIKERF